MELRESKGIEIAYTQKIENKDTHWIVPSQRSAKKYRVELNNETPGCDCADFESRRQKCKHIFAVEYAIKLDANAKAPHVQENTIKPTYGQIWPAYNAAQTDEKAHFQDLLHDLCQLIDEPPRKGRGRPGMKMSDLIFAAGVKIYGGMSGRRNQTDLRDARERRFLSKEVHYNTVFKYLEMKSLTPYLQQLIVESSLPLKSVEVDFAIDSSGFSTCQFVRWFDVKYGNDEDWHDWIKMHLICGVKTNIVTGVEISRRYANDSPYFKPLLNTTATNFEMKEVSADKEYLSANNLRLTLMKGAQPYIPFKMNSSPGQNTTIWNRMLYFYLYHQEEFNQHYHKRSNVETTFSMIKAKFGSKLRSKTDDAQVNEAMCKVLCHNICVVIQSMYELGIIGEFVGKTSACPRTQEVL